MKKFDIHRYWIPGKSMSVVFIPLGIWTFVYFMASWFRFSLRVDEALSLLGMDWRTGWRDTAIDPSRKMIPFNDIMKGCFSGYWLILLLCVLLILERYMWLRRDRSIYIMKRLPAAETFRRCALLLIIYAAVTLILTFIVVMLLKNAYVARTPEQCLQPQGPVNVFGALSLSGRFRGWMHQAY